jgi:Cu+-exporting ATPase
MSSLASQLWSFKVSRRYLAKVHDLVCGMEIDETKAAATSVFEGKTYYFCAPGCKRFFDEDPSRFAANLEVANAQLEQGQDTIDLTP